MQLNPDCCVTFSCLGNSMVEYRSPDSFFTAVLSGKTYKIQLNENEIFLDAFVDQQRLGVALQHNGLIVRVYEVMFGTLLFEHKEKTKHVEFVQFLHPQELTFYETRGQSVKLLRLGPQPSLYKLKLSLGRRRFQIDPRSIKLVTQENQITLYSAGVQYAWTLPPIDQKTVVTYCHLNQTPVQVIGSTPTSTFDRQLFEVAELLGENLVEHTLAVSADCLNNELQQARVCGGRVVCSRRQYGIPEGSAFKGFYESEDSFYLAYTENDVTIVERRSLESPEASGDVLKRIETPTETVVFRQVVIKEKNCLFYSDGHRIYLGEDVFFFFQMDDTEIIRQFDVHESLLAVSTERELRVFDTLQEETVLEIPGIQSIQILGHNLILLSLQFETQLVLLNQKKHFAYHIRHGIKHAVAQLRDGQFLIATPKTTFAIKYGICLIADFVLKLNQGRVVDKFFQAIFPLELYEFLDAMAFPKVNGADVRFLKEQISQKRRILTNTMDTSPDMLNSLGRDGREHLFRKVQENINRGQIARYLLEGTVQDRVSALLAATLDLDILQFVVFAWRLGVTDASLVKLFADRLKPNQSQKLLIHARGLRDDAILHQFAVSEENTVSNILVFCRNFYRLQIVDETGFTDLEAQQRDSANARTLAFSQYKLLEQSITSLAQNSCDMRYPLKSFPPMMQRQNGDERRFSMQVDPVRSSTLADERLIRRSVDFNLEAARPTGRNLSSFVIGAPRRISSVPSSLDEDTQ